MASSLSNSVNLCDGIMETFTNLVFEACVVKNLHFVQEHYE